MPDLSVVIVTASYATAAVAFTALSILLAVNLQRDMPSRLFLLSAIVTATWAGLLALGSFRQELSANVLFALELMVDASWLWFLSTAFAGSVSSSKVWLVRWGGVGLAAIIALLGAAQALISPDQSAPGSLLVLGSIVTSLYALVLIEQIYSNARSTQRDGISFLCLGVGGLFLYDLVLYSDTALLGGISGSLWSARGFVVAMTMPLLLLAARRSKTWSMRVFVSRQVVFHTATLVGAGVYLTLIGFAGSVLKRSGEEWGATAQVVLISAALIGLAMFFLSRNTLASLKVFISKHFFANRYDYREEWLRLIRTLTDEEGSLSLQKRSIKAILDILDGESGRLWLASERKQSLDCVASWDTECSNDGVSADSALAAFVQRTGWVIDLDEYRRKPEHYQGADFGDDVARFGGERFLVPLVNDGRLVGLVSVAVRPGERPLNYEDHDLLKTAGLQIAAFLAQEKTVEMLAESRQFEAYNKLTAYLMHDLKNVSAQLALVAKNAEKHRRNPDFVDDAMETVQGSQARLKNVIDHLHHGRVIPRVETVELGKLVLRAVSQCADHQPEPTASLPDQRVYVSADGERLQMAIFHAIRNAQDATPGDGRVAVTLEEQDDAVLLTIADNGSGMTPEFVENYFFKPFYSTKGAQGMGIGAYQIKETIEALGGRLDVHSEPGEGTRLSVQLPRLKRNDARRV